ncbi:MAG: ABC transporter substrate-binding protein [Candidatus Rokubacteria bacterium]|nr:ABC transporter substrate-binding protein [Candidatus Rokubacteria bacterium]
MSAVVMLAIGLAVGSHPALAQTVTKEMKPAPPTDQTPPLDLVRSSVGRVLTMVQSQPVGAAETGKWRAEIRRVAEELFDLDEMARRMLPQHWQERTPQEHQEFIRLFTDLLDRAYLRALGSYPLATITFQGESVDGPYAQVRSRFVTERGGELPVEYRLLKSQAGWGVYDLVVDGVSLISSYRSQFSSLLRRSSFAQLLERLRDRNTYVASEVQMP